MSYCVLCRKYKTAGNHEISYFGFPKDRFTRLKWINFCKLKFRYEEVPVTYKICSLHFDEINFIDNRKGGGLRILKRGSIPSVKAAVLESCGDNNQIPCLSVNVQNVCVNASDSPSLVKQADLECHTPIKHSPLAEGRYVEDIEVNLPNVSVNASDSPSHVKQANLECTTPIKRSRLAEPRYVGDIDVDHISTPRRTKRCLQLCKTIIRQKNLHIQKLKKRNGRLTKKIGNLKDLLHNLKDRNLLSSAAVDNMMTNIPDALNYIIQRPGKQQGSKYGPEIRKFALTVQFYSTKAYEYIRRTFNNLLPHPVSLRKWYSVIDGNPGFTKEVFHALKTKVRYSSGNIICNLVIDEVYIRQKISFDGHKFHGHVDLGLYGVNTDCENLPPAKCAFVFMLVCLNGYWKIPIGYFLIDGLSGENRARLVENSLHLIQDTGIKVFSITFDGAAVNTSMCTYLGANLDIMSKNVKPYFINPATNEPIYIFFDPCHMLKLVRNAFGDKGVLLNSNNNEIYWKNIVLLQELQEKEGLHAATKLTKKHIKYEDNKMNVKLAAQTFSESVSSALKFVNILNIPGFCNCEETAEFCCIFNNIFDILNCRNRFSSKCKYNKPLSDDTLHFLKCECLKFEQYIIGLKDSNGRLLIDSPRKTGFVGFIFCLRNLFQLYEIVKTNGMKYLLTYKVNQDHLETFFSALRSRGGSNNNPDATQFQAAYKRLLVRHEVESSERGNCLIGDVQILHVSSAYTKRPHFIDETDFVSNSFDHDYINCLWGLSQYVEDVVKYVSGFVVYKLIKLGVCSVCKTVLTDKNCDSLLIALKNRGKLQQPSKDVITICLKTEMVIKQFQNHLFVKQNIKDFLILKAYSLLYDLFDNETMNVHIKEQELWENHKVYLIKSIIEIYVKLRLHHEARNACNTSQFIRHKYTKLIIFKNQ